MLAGLLAYANSFAGPFVFDDAGSITNNPTIQAGWNLGRMLRPPANETVGRRPLVNLSLAFNYALGGSAVGGYHAVNLAIHLVAGLTLFGLVRRTLRRPALAGRFADAALPLALAMALLWTLHPLQTEAVSYVVQRAESLMGLCYLFTLYAFVRSIEREALPFPLAAKARHKVEPYGGKAKRKWYDFCSLAFSPPARTIADLAASDRVGQPHLLEAIPYRSLDRTVFY